MVAVRDDSLPVGDVRFYDNVLPPLVANTYTINLTHSIASPDTLSGDGANTLQQAFTNSQKFTVLAPQFQLNAGEIQSRFPPPMATGDYDSILASVTFETRALPWERTLDGSAPVQPFETVAPWFALVMFEETELIDPPGGSAQNPTKVSNHPVTEVIYYGQGSAGHAPGPGPNVLGPKLSQSQISYIDWNNVPQCQTIDIAAQTFVDVLPRRGELPYLCHARQVNASQKETQFAKSNGWYSVALCNRLPKPNARNVVHLVSLEGFQDYLTGNINDLKGFNTVRLVSLDSWYFTSQDPQENFSQLMQNLDGQLLQLPVPQVTAPTAAQKTVAAAFGRGYAPMNFKTLLGEKTVAWYRGPLLPIPTQRDVKPPFPNADAAKIYDPATGMFDVSYAVAWQIGRLLALSNQSFAVDVLEWKRSGHHLVKLVQERLNLFQTYIDSNGPPQLVSLLEPQMMLRHTVSLLANSVTPQLIAESGQPRLHHYDSAGLRNKFELMPGLMAHDELAQVLAAGTDPHHALRQRAIR